MQACARIGATHSVVFGGFSAKSLQERIIDAGAVAGDHRRRADARRQGAAAEGHRRRSARAWAAATRCKQRGRLPAHRRRRRHGTPGRDLWMHDVLRQPADRPASRNGSSAEHPLFILYTSGSTGKPKGVQHSTGGYLLWAMLTMKWTFDIKPDDVFWCTADIGWVTGHTYVAYGPLAVGATADRLRRRADLPERRPLLGDDRSSTRCTHLLHRADRDPLADQGRRRRRRACIRRTTTCRRLRLLGSVGEPINPEAWMWYYKNVGDERCPIVDTFWQTETGGHMITPLPGAHAAGAGLLHACRCPASWPRSSTRPAHDVPNGQGGILVVKRPWPSMIRTIWDDPERFRKSYFPEELGGKYLPRRRRRDPQQGHRLLHDHRPHRRRAERVRATGMGTMEIESALVSNPTGGRSGGGRQAGRHHRRSRSAPSWC